MPRITAVATALPPHRVPQTAVREALARVCGDDPAIGRRLPLFERTGVDTRYFVKPLAWYADGPSFETRNRVFAEEGVRLAVEATRSCLRRAAIEPTAVDFILWVTTTGLMTPSLDARLQTELGCRSDVRRLPLFGLGCAGGAGALTRASDLLRAYPSGRALVVSLELCSLVFSPVARSATDVVGTALFGDGAVTALLVGDDVEEAGPEIRRTRTHLFSHAPDLMGWRFTEDGMRLVLSRDVPDFVASDVEPVVTRFLQDHDLGLRDVRHLLLHPGGAKVLTRYRSALAVSDQDLYWPRETMRRYGNQSSASVLFMLNDLLEEQRPAPGDVGLMLAMGPGFAAEMLSLAW